VSFAPAENAGGPAAAAGYVTARVGSGRAVSKHRLRGSRRDVIQEDTPTVFSLTPREVARDRFEVINSVNILGRRSRSDTTGKRFLWDFTLITTVFVVSNKLVISISKVQKFQGKRATLEPAEICFSSSYHTAFRLPVAKKGLRTRKGSRA
jgi:hypothetical protein